MQSRLTIPTSVDEALRLLDMEFWTSPRVMLATPRGGTPWPKTGYFRVELASIRPHQLDELVRAIHGKYDQSGRTVLPLKEVLVSFTDGEIRLILDKSRADEMLPWPDPPDD